MNLIICNSIHFLFLCLSVSRLFNSSQSWSKINFSFDVISPRQKSIEWTSSFDLRRYFPRIEVEKEEEDKDDDGDDDQEKKKKWNVRWKSISETNKHMSDRWMIEWRMMTFEVWTPINNTQGQRVSSTEREKIQRIIIENNDNEDYYWHDQRTREINI